MSTSTPPLAQRLAALDGRLDTLRDASPSGAERATLKSDIIDLFRDVDGELAELTRLKDEVKELAAKWKRLPAEPEIITSRVDHLGASTFVAKGWSAISAGDHAAAAAALERALELAPEDLEAAALLGWALMGQERYDDALSVLQGVLAREPSHALARANVGYVCLRKGIYGEAIEHLVRAARAESGDRKAELYATFYLGLVYQRREMFDDAVTFFQRAITLGPNLVEARYELGRSLWFGGDRTAAVEAWRAGAASGKFNAWAKRCGAVCTAVEQGGEPPALEDVAQAA